MSTQRICLTSRLAGPEEGASAVISGSRRDLLALLLGRPPRVLLAFTGDVVFGESFQRAFPGP